MAIDTRDKRQSAMNASWIEYILPDADGTVDDPDQQHVLNAYSGIAFGSPAGGRIMFSLVRHGGLAWHGGLAGSGGGLAG